MRTICFIWMLVFGSLMFLSSESGAAIDEKLLREAKLQIVWQNALALNPKEKVQRITILGDHIYILTDSNYLFCLDRNTGRLNFSISIAKAKLPVSEPVSLNNTVYIIAANHLVAIDMRSGDELYRKKISFSVSAPVAVNPLHFYLAGADHLLHITDVNLYPVFMASADDRSAITSVISNTKSVLFATQGGSVICMDANAPKKLWQYDTVGPIKAELVKKSDWIYVSGRDTNIYKLSANKGELMWKFLTSPVRATETIVYQYAQNKGLYAIDANSGKQLWLLPDGAEFLAQDGSTAYVFDKNNMCVVMDNAEAKNIYTINFASVTGFAANLYDSKIYVMEDKNILCIQPIKR